MDDFDAKLQHAFCVGLMLPKDTPFQDLVFAQSAAWDSIAHLQLIAAIEEEFNILIDTQDMLAMSSYAVATEIVRKYVSKLP